jgi:alpha-L-rhamnosidase
MLTEHYQSASNFIYFFTNFWPNFLFNNVSPFQGNGDWANADQFGSLPSYWPSGQGYAAMSENVLGNCHYAYVADIMAKASQVLRLQAQTQGLTSLANTYGGNYSAYTNVAAKVRSSFTNSANGLVAYDSSGNITKVGNGTQGDYGSALFFKMVPTTQYTNCLYWLLNDPNAGILNYNHLANSSSTNHFSNGLMTLGRTMLQLSPNGYNTNAYKLLLDYSFPSWLYQITNGGAIYNGPGNYGATTSWERRNGWVSGSGGGTYAAGSSGNSFNHLWIGAEPGEWIYRTMVGINPDENNPGFQNTVIHPQPPLPGGPITNAWASFNSIHGAIVASWTCTTNSSSTNLALTLTVPANVTASVYIPSTVWGNITEGGVPAANSPGVFYYQTTNSSTLFEIGSGTYSFNANSISF